MQIFRYLDGNYIGFNNAYIFQATKVIVADVMACVRCDNNGYIAAYAQPLDGGG